MYSRSALYNWWPVSGLHIAFRLLTILVLRFPTLPSASFGTVPHGYHISLHHLLLRLLPSPPKPQEAASLQACPRSASFCFLMRPLWGCLPHRHSEVDQPWSRLCGMVFHCIPHLPSSNSTLAVVWQWSLCGHMHRFMDSMLVKNGRWVLSPALMVWKHPLPLLTTLSYSSMCSRKNFQRQCRQSGGIGLWSAVMLPYVVDLLTYVNYVASNSKKYAEQKAEMLR